MAHVEKIEVQYTDGSVQYFDEDKIAKKSAEQHLNGRSTVASDRIAWIDENTAFLVDLNNDPRGYEVYITPMLIPEEEWQKIVQKELDQAS